MWNSNPTWGAPRIQAELGKIGIEVSDSTTFPSAQWTAQQVVEAFPYETRPRFLLRDRDKIFGSTFVRRVGAMGADSITDTGAGSRPDLVGLRGSLTVDLCSADVTSSSTPLGRPLPQADPANPTACQVLQSAPRHP
jgi:hypothetical protein